MKALYALAIVAFLAVLAQARERDFDLLQHPRDLFDEYLTEYPQVFRDERHRQDRYRIFLQNVEKIKKLNKEHAGHATFGLNRFSLMSEEEFKQYIGVKLPDFFHNLTGVARTWEPEILRDLPTSVDWRTHNPPVVTPVKDQGMCGSCWAFSSTGNIEGQWALAGNPLTSLSEQNLVDCDHICLDGECDSGCNGGLMANAFTYVIKNGGINTASAYPYKGRDGTCKFDPSPSALGAKISSFKMLPENADQIAQFVATKGPVSVAVDASSWQSYRSGVITKCSRNLNHGVLVVGYGVSDKNVPYWIVKNSWGSRWGMEGYLMVQRGKEDMCGINQYVISSAV